MTMTLKEAHGFWNDYSSDREVENAEREYRSLSEWRHNQGRLGRFCGMGLAYLLENTGDMVGTNREIDNAINTGASVIRINSAFERYSEEALEDQKESYEDDPEWAKRRYKAETAEDAEHPWGEEEYKAMQAWLELPAYEWMLFADAVKQAGMEAMEDNLDFFIVEDVEKTSYVHEAIRKKTEHLMEKFIQRVKEGQCESKQQQPSVA